MQVEDHHPPRLHQMAAFVERAGELVSDEPGLCLAVCVCVCVVRETERARERASERER